MLRRSLLAGPVAVLLLLAACSGDDDTASTTTSESTTTTAPEPLTVLVTNDDGIGAPGIDALVTALDEVDGLELVIVAPAENQSGSGDKTTDGPVEHADSTTASGVAGTAVAGFPADSVNVALDELGVEPDLVVSGVNEGQNVGPVVPVSGTVGAARTAARRGIPAVASSAGIGDLADFELGAQLVADWVVEHRDELAEGSVSADTVTSYNVPGCQAGEPKEVVEVAIASVIPEGVDVFKTADCSVAVATEPADDVAALQAGHVAVSQVPLEL